MNTEEKLEFKRMEKEQLNTFLSPRSGELKLGQCRCDLSAAKYVIIGIKESVGPRANKGRGGAEFAFSAFLPVFMNMQSNEFLRGDKIHILGEIVVKKEEEPLTEIVEELDDFVFKILQNYLSEGQIPIIIGGGHNNAYPLIKYSSLRFNEKINVVNLDAHADYRLLEGRHSGNPFSYAFRDGFIHKYFVMGLHQAYNSQQILDDLRRDKHYFTFHEEYVSKRRNYITDFEYLNESIAQTKVPLGIELDLDVIEHMPSSAHSPIGIPSTIARNYLDKIPSKNKVAYLHLPEGAPIQPVEKRIVGKTLAYLVWDFIVSCNNNHEV